MADTKFTVEEFNQQIVEFRQLFGSKEFWKQPVEIRDLAVKGMGHVYFNTVCVKPDDRKYIAGIFTSTVSEYVRRGVMIGKLT
jgi:hypothetical protein